MINIYIPAFEGFNEQTEEFVNTKEYNLLLEHSLISLAKWESKHHKPFHGQNNKTNKEVIDYIRCMTITPNVEPNVYYYIPETEMVRIKEYIDDPMTATTFSGQTRTSREIITAELIYYWMVTFNIPFECQKWHLNRLLTLINVCAIKNSPPKKMSKREIQARNAALNAARRKALGTKG